MRTSIPSDLKQVELKTFDVVVVSSHNTPFYYTLRKFCPGRTLRLTRFGRGGLVSWTEFNKGIHRGRKGERNNSSTNTRLNHTLMRYISIITAIEGLKKTLDRERGGRRRERERERNIIVHK